MLSIHRALAAVCALGFIGALCGCGVEAAHTAVTTGITTMPASEINVKEAATQNRNRLVSKQFSGQVKVLKDDFGLEAVRLFFADSDALIVAQNDDSALLRAASLSVSQRVPMVVWDQSVSRDINALVTQLGASRVLVVGQVPLSESSGALTVMHDPGTTKAMGQLTAFQPTSQVVASQDRMVQAVANLDPNAHTELKAAWAVGQRIEDKKVGALPAQSARDGQMSPIIVATPETPLAAVATAKAYGGQVRVMPSGDPLDTKASYAMVAGLADGPLVALGPEFGDANLLSDRIRHGWSE